MASIDLEHIVHRFDDGTLGLGGIDLRIEDGEFVALVGPSGSGKTTLLRVIAGFVAPGEGRVLIDGREVAGDRFVPPEQRGLGRVFQQHALWPHWNVERNVDYPLRLAGVPARSRRDAVEQTLALVGLAGLRRRAIAELSGGQRQRVALARALVGAPGVLLLDEALSALDEPLRAALRLELRALAAQRSLTVVHVTHDREEALAIADRVIVLDSGRILQAAAPDRLLAAPASPVVARFIADAMVLPALVAGGVAQVDGHPLRAAVDAAAGSGELVLLPEDVLLEPGGEARVVSSLFGRQAHQVVADWQGLRLQARVHGRRPRVGDAVTVRVRQARFYPD